MAGQDPSRWVFSVSPENWQVAREKKVWAVRTERLKGLISKGDCIVLYVIGAGAFCTVLRIVGDWKPSTEVTWADEKEEDKIKYPYQAEAEIVQEGFAEAKALVPSLSFVVDKQYWGVYLQGNPGNRGRPIPESDYQLILETMKAHPLPQDLTTILRAKAVRRIDERRAEPPKEVGEALEGVPRHNEIRDMIYEIGKFEGKISQTEYPIDNLRLDVVWKVIEAGNPKWAFEVQMAGNFYEALTKLKHAWDKWNSRPYLVTTEEYAEQARWLLEGSFHEMKDDAKILNWQDIVKLHRLLKDAHKIRTELRL